MFPSFMHSRAQSSVELLVILAISIILLSLLVEWSSDQLYLVKADYSVRLARQSLSTLIEGIDSAFSQGNGTIRFVTVRWPEGIDPSSTRIVGNSIFLRVYSTDIVGTAVPSIGGDLNVYAGEQRIKIAVNDSNVTLGSLSITSDVSSIYLPMVQDSNDLTHVTFTNLSSGDANITLSVDWSHSLVGVGVSPSITVLSPFESIEADINVAAGTSAYGNYVGSIRMEADFGSTSESLSIPLNVEVFPSSSGFLSILPSSITLGVPIGDTNTTSIQLCNTGDSPLTGITFTPSTGDAGDWVEDMATISTIGGNSCTNMDVVVTAPGDVNLGIEGGSLLVSDSTGGNVDILPLSITVLGQSDSFEWDWSLASTVTDTVSGFVLRNGREEPLQITQIAIQDWWDCDTALGNLSQVEVDGNNIFLGSVGDGESADVTDFNILGGSSFSDNSLVFESDVSDEGEAFQSVVTFSDGTTYTSSTYGNGCAIDTIPPSPIADLVAWPGADPESIRLTFTFPGDNNFSGTAAGAEFKMFSQPDADDPSVYAAGTLIPFSQEISPGGTSGSLTITDLNVGETYFFTAVFTDDRDQNGGLSNIASGRPWNRYQFSQGDFNISQFSHSLSSDPEDGEPGDINQFLVNNFRFNAGLDRNIVMRITPDDNEDDSWIISLGIRSTTLTSIRIWYPYASVNGNPSTTPTFSATTSQALSSGADLLSSSLINSPYRYDGASVSMSRPNNLYVTWTQNVADFNVSHDMVQAVYP